MEGKKKKPLPLEAGGAGFCKLFVLLINEPGNVCVCVYVWMCVGYVGVGSTEGR